MVAFDACCVNLVANFRSSSGLTQTQLAERVGVSKNTICNIESCKSLPSIRLALLLAYVLDIPVDRLFVLRGSF